MDGPRSSETNRPRLVLIGAGHAHLHVAQHARAFVDLGMDVTLVDPDAFWYSGMATGMLGGLYQADDDRIDPERLITRHGGRFVRARMTALDRDRRLVYLDAGEPLPYDAVSLNLGSETATAPLPGAAEHAHTVKPIAGLWRLRQRLEARFTGAGRTRPMRIVVVGTGPTGCEIAANLEALAHRCGGAVALTLVGRSDRLLKGHPTGAGRRLAQVLAERGVAVELNCDVQRIEPDAVLARDGRRFESELTLAATGLRAPALVQQLGLAADARAGLKVNAYLRSMDDGRVFAAGDCIDFAGHELPKVGVFGVRAAPVLHHNLLATLTGGTLQPYRPQRRYLIVLNLGRGDGLALRGGLYWYGRLALRLKDRIDRRFMAQYRAADDA